MTSRAEHQLIAAMVAGRDVEVAVEVRPDDFADPRCEALWRAGWEILDGGRQVTPLALEKSLRAMGTKEAIGGLEAIASFDSAYTTERDIREASAEIRRSAKLRRLHDLNREVAELARAGEVDAEGLIADLRGRLDSIERGTDEVFKPLHECVRKSLDMAQRASKGELVRIPTGLRVLDDHTNGGLLPGWVVVTGGVQKMGKSALGLTMLRAAARAGYPCLAFSQEMQDHELGTRWLAAESDVPADVIAKGPGEIDWRSLQQAYQRSKSQDFDVVDDKLDIHRLVSLWRRWRRRNREKPGVVLIDYIQIIDGAPEKGMNREQEVTRMSRVITRAAGSLGCVAIVLTQLLVKSIERRDDKRPRRSDIRESSAILDDCDLGILIHRPWVFDTKQDPKLAELHVCAFRHGSSPHVLHSVFMPRQTAFGDVQ